MHVEIVTPVAYGQLWVHPADALPDPAGRGSDHVLLWPSVDRVGFALLTGGTCDELTLSIELLEEAPTGAIDEMGEVVDEMSLDAAHPLFVTWPDGDHPDEPAVTPHWRGPTRVRAHARGREPLPDGDQDQRQLLQLWPEPATRAPQVLRDEERRR